MPTSDIKKGPLYVDSTNNRVGIGTSSPATKAEIYGTAAAQNLALRVTNTATDGYSTLQLFDDQAGIYRAGSGVSAYGGASSLNILTVGGHPITLGTSNTVRLTVDATGRVTMPYQPAFSAINGAGNNGVAYPIPFTTAVTNVGGYYNTSNYRFTAPVAGTYFFMHNAMSNGGYNRTQYKVNGSYVGAEFFSPNASYANFVGNIILTLAVSDYVEIFNDIDSTGQGDIHSNYRAFSGFLIG